MFSKLTGLVLPPYVTYLAYALLGFSLFVYGYVKGQSTAYEKQLSAQVETVVLQGKTTTKVITKYIKAKEKQEPKEKEITNESIKYAESPNANTSILDNTFIRVYDGAVTGSLPPLPSGESGNTTGVEVSQALPLFVENVQIARQWRDRALLCEAWVKYQEEESK